MKIVCPACNAAYDVPDASLQGDRIVRCARCGTDWAPVVALPETPPDRAAERVEPPPAIPALAASEAVVEPEPVPEPEPLPEIGPRRMALDEGVFPIAAPAAPVVRARRASPLLAVAWVLSLLAVIGGVAVLGFKRDQVMAAWPPSIRAYAALGLAARP